MNQLQRPLTAFRSTMKFMGDSEFEDLSNLKYKLTVRDKKRIEMVTGLGVATPEQFNRRIRTQIVAQTVEKSIVNITPLQHQGLQDLNSISSVKRDRIIFNISSNNISKQFARVELPSYCETKLIEKKQKQHKRNQSAADILNRVTTTKYQNKLKQLKILAATPTPGIKTLKASVKSPAKSFKRRQKNKTKLIDGGELNSQDMYSLKRQEVLSRLKSTQLTKEELEKLAISLQDNNGFRILCSVVLLQIYIKETELKIDQSDYFVQLLVDAMERVVSTSDFYHDRALDCLFHLVKLDSEGDYHKRIRKIINVKDLGLCENYWKVIADNVDTHLFKKLKLENLLVDHFQLYSDSLAIQESHAKIIHALRSTNIALFQNLLDILLLSDNQTETQSLCIYAIREYFSHTEYSQLSKLIACREGLPQKMVAILQTTDLDPTKILLPLSQVMVAILEQSQKIHLYGFKKNNSEKRDPRKPRTAADMHNFSSVKGAPNMPSESIFKLMLIQAGIFNTIDFLCAYENSLQVCQVGLNLLSMFTNDFETLQVKLPLSLVCRAEMPLTQNQHTLIALQIVDHLKLRSYDTEHMQIVRRLLQEIPKAKVPVSELVNGLLCYLKGLPIELWRGQSSLISALQMLDKQSYFAVLGFICEFQKEDQDFFQVQGDYNLLI